MATPAAARRDDFAEWKRSVDAKLKQALSRAATRPQGGVASGDFEINGGAMTIRGDGGLSMISADGVPVFSVKGQTGEPDPDGHPQPEVRMYRADGSVAFYMWDPLPFQDNYQQFWAWFDRNGNVLLGDDTTSGRGLARPYLPYEVKNENGSDYVTPTSTASFLDVHYISGWIQNPRMKVPMSVTAPATGPGEVQIVDDATGAILAGPTTVPAGTTIAPFYEFNVDPTSNMWEYHYFRVQTRRPSGTGNIQSRVWSAYGVQS
jgi:hypothetical protein